MSSKMWGGRFTEVPSEFVEEFGAAIKDQIRLCSYDIQGSLAHVTMLGETGILTAEDVELIKKGLKQVAEEIEKGQFIFAAEDEDIHMAIEKRLTQIIGQAGGRLHTGRSRNDQCIVDSYLYIREAAKTSQHLILEIQKSIFNQAQLNFGKIMPGFTHLQTAQPVLVSHWIMAYFWMLKRDYDRLQSFIGRLCECPLGAAALAGTDFPIDRWSTAKQLGFKKPTENSIDTVADRDYCIELASIAAISYMHLSRLCEEIIIFASQEYKFLELSDDFTTGSSIMPQKKNCDFAELIKGRSGRMFGFLMSSLTMMKGIPLAYDKDMQEDKEAVFDAIDTVKQCLRVLTAMISTMQILKDNMKKAALKGFINATDCADYLTKKGMPFRDAYKTVGQLVAQCVREDKSLADLTLEEYKTHSDVFENDVYEAIDLKTCVRGRKVIGGPAPEEVTRQISVIEKFVSEHKVQE